MSRELPGLGKKTRRCRSAEALPSGRGLGQARPGRREAGRAGRPSEASRQAGKGFRVAEGGQPGTARPRGDRARGSYDKQALRPAAPRRTRRGPTRPGLRPAAPRSHGQPSPAPLSAPRLKLSSSRGRSRRIHGQGKCSDSPRRRDPRVAPRRGGPEGSGPPRRLHRRRCHRVTESNTSSRPA